jgi:HSP20 family protein
MANITRRNGRESLDVASRGRGQVEPSSRGLFDPFGIMGELMRWDPFARVERSTGLAAGGFVPAVDVRETTEAYSFQVELPGVQEENVDISLAGNRLTISGQRTEEKRDEKDRYLSHEFSYGSFSRAFSLPKGTDPDNVRAEMKDGVLTITVPKRPEVQARRIPLGGRTGGKSSKS